MLWIRFAQRMIALENKRTTGDLFETKACKYIEEHNGKVIMRNFRCRQGEIDIIALDEGYRVFIEVKYRASDRFGEAAYAAGKQKQNKICRVSDFYRKRYGIDEYTPIRFDVVTIDTDTFGAEIISWHKNAFEYIY